jgi:hypothetical protein
VDSFTKTVLAGLVVLVVILGFVYRNDALNTQDELEQAEVDRAIVAKNVDELRDQVMELGEEPVVPPAQDIIDDEITDIELIPGPEGEKGEKGDKGDPGDDAPPPSVNMLTDALRRLCGDCLGPRGLPGEDGATGPAPDDVAVQTALTAICGDCRGADGIDGLDGTDGADGTDGTNGTNGADGQDGAPGPAVASLTFALGGRTIVCTDPDGDLTYDCVVTEPPPKP